MITLLCWGLGILALILLGLALLIAMWEDLAQRGDEALYPGPDEPWYLRGSDE